MTAIILVDNTGIQWSALSSLTNNLYMLARYENISFPPLFLYNHAVILALAKRSVKSVKELVSF